MILTQAPLRISFVGGGTDQPNFYHRYPGRVISVAINKFIYLVIKPTHLVDKFIIRYQATESVSHPQELKHTRIRSALLDMGITKKGLEIGSFADIPAKTGLGSSSSFSTALIKGLAAYQGRELNRRETAEAACHLEIDLLKEPIGKQDQYAASFGGFNMLQFNPDDSVQVDPIFLSYNKQQQLEKHILLFFTGITRDTADILKEQQQKMYNNFDIYKEMSDSVFKFRDKLLDGDIYSMAQMLNEGWLNKKSLANTITNTVIDSMYSAGMQAGALGGKILGAGGGGCILFLAPPERHKIIKETVTTLAFNNRLANFQQISVKFTQSGTEILYNNYQ